MKILLPSSLEQFVGESGVDHLVYDAPFALSKVEENIQKRSKDTLTRFVIGVFPFVFILRTQEIFCRKLMNDAKVVQEIKDFKADLLVSDMAFKCGPLIQDLLDVPRMDLATTSIVPFMMQPLQVPCPVAFIPQMGIGIVWP